MRKVVFLSCLAACSSSREAELHLVTYADGGNYEVTQQLLDETKDIAGFSTHAMWNKQLLKQTSFFRKHDMAMLTLPFRRGGWWKPYIIWNQLRQVEENILTPK